MIDKIGYNGNTTNIENSISLFADPTMKNKMEDRNISGEKSKSINGIEECQTCKNRRYQDGSGDPGVSMKSPTKMNPAQAATGVFSHEREHYTREIAKAEDEGREVLQNDIRIFTAVCPECGKVYVSGGETRTVTRKKSEQAEFAKKFFDENVGVYLPKELNELA